MRYEYAWIIQLLALALFCSVATTAMAAEYVRPAVLKRISPHYPRDAAKKKIEGCVTVAFEITQGGVADNYQILDSQPKGVFDNATLVALYKWRFEAPVENTNNKQRYAQKIEYKMKRRGIPPPSGCREPGSFRNLDTVVQSSD